MLRDEAARLRRSTAVPQSPGRQAHEHRNEHFALVCEVARRTLGLRPFDVQLLGALALSEGWVVEMAAGEGKTLAAVPAIAYGALEGRGYHVLTANDYLARRDAEWMGPIYAMLGLTVGHVSQGMPREQRKLAYLADVTYVAATEVGFDFLRDRLETDSAGLVQRPFHAALVDEVDSILIDEARIPLVIAGGNTVPEGLVLRATEAVRQLRAGRDYCLNPGLRSVMLTEQGIDRIEGVFGSGNLCEPHNLALFTAVTVALYALAVLRRDVDYILRDGCVQLVDEFKGRVAEQRRWPDGVHTAIEAKEGARLTREGRILGTLTLQSFIGLYPRVAGMTGTAATQAEEFRDRYGLRVVVIPPNRPCIRRDHQDLVFLSREAKEAALETDVRKMHLLGRPVLIGTASVEESERLALRFQAGKIPCKVLNARNDALEANIVAEAGDLGAVTISTNMAGRGTDIKLGGAREERAHEVQALGGLFVAGTNRFEARRIDLQLRGRAGRQGDPGESRFYLSLEDDLFVRHGLRDALPPGMLISASVDAIDDPRVGREIGRAQRILEGRNAAVRKSLWQYDRLVDEQRRLLYQFRDAVLFGEPHLARLAPERHSALVARLGDAEVAEAERRITLTHIDRHWSDYLAEMAEVREGIVLRVIGNQDPVYEFQKIAVESFDLHLAAIQREAVETLARAEVDDSRLRLDLPESPGTTWTYLMNEETFGTPMERFMDALAKQIKSTWGAGKGPSHSAPR